MEQQLLNILNPDNTARQNALKEVERLSSERPDEYAMSLCNFLLTSDSSNPNLEMQKRQLREVSSLVLHKNLLSNDKNFSRISGKTLENISQLILQGVDKDGQTMSWGLLKRSAEILVEISVNCGKNDALFQQIQIFHNDVLTNRCNGKGFVSLAKFGLYCLELLCEYGSDTGFVSQHSGQFLALFENSFTANNNEIKSFCTGPICMFLVGEGSNKSGVDLQNLLKGLVEVLIMSVKGNLFIFKYFYIYYYFLYKITMSQILTIRRRRR